MALSVALADTFLLRSMMLYAVPTFLAPAFPTRDSLLESRCKITFFFAASTIWPQLFFRFQIKVVANNQSDSGDETTPKFIVCLV